MYIQDLGGVWVNPPKRKRKKTNKKHGGNFPIENSGILKELIVSIPSSENQAKNRSMIFFNNALGFDSSRLARCNGATAWNTDFHGGMFSIYILYPKTHNVSKVDFIYFKICLCVICFFFGSILKWIFEGLFFFETLRLAAVAVASSLFFSDWKGHSSTFMLSWANWISFRFVFTALTSFCAGATSQPWQCLIGSLLAALCGSLCSVGIPTELCRVDRMAIGKMALLV